MQRKKEEYSKLIYNSSLIFKIKKVALPTLKVFQQEVTKKYPNISIKIDTQTIIKEMVDSFSKALSSLFEEDDIKFNNLHYAGGYVLVFFSSNLWTYWKGEYLYPKIPEYQNLMFLRSMYIYSKIDYMLNYQYTDKIQKIYNYFTQSDQSNIIHANDSKDNLVLLEDFKKQKKTYTNQKFADSLTNYLENLLLQEYYKAFDKINIDDNLNNICNLFEINAIMELISSIKSSN
ncbi:hypothetical protein [Rickettsia bellii]|uniref:Uncharacterized protein n=1 Tax=Rickettsia bellii (strain RML369-C) TaxID=336407 RepID=Q1RHG7_RICBR|nr:hypothetical protein [Rickettsia bellii]ABE05197.1 unknown [Rickettsia bellii RML369-C]